MSTYYVPDDGNLKLLTPTCSESVNVTNGAGLEFSVPVEFDGWSDGSTKVSSPYSPTGNTTLIAQWKASTAGKTTVTFLTNGLSGATGNIVASDVAIGAAITNFPNVTKEGQTVTKWNNKNGAGSWSVDSKGKPSATCTVTDNMTLEPEFQKNAVTVKFKIDGEIIDSMEQHLFYGDKVVKPEDPASLEITLGDGTKYSCKFLYWAVDTLGSAQWNFDDPVTQNMTLVAIRNIPDGTPVETCVVTFHPENGGSLFRRNTLVGHTVEKPAPDPSREKYTFVHWAKKVGTEYVEFNFDEKLTGNLDLYAVWARNADVEFNSDGGSYIRVVTLPFGNIVAEPVPPTKNGYVFLGWSTTRQKDKSKEDFDKPGVKFDFSTEITKELMEETGSTDNCLVLWAWYDCNTKVVFHYRNAGAGDPSEELVEVVPIREGDSRTLPYRVPRDPADPDAPRVIPKGKAFSHWEYENHTVAKAGDPVKLGTVVHVYAVWNSGFRVLYVTGPATPGGGSGIEYSYHVVSYPAEDKVITPPTIYDQASDKIIVKWYRDEEKIEDVDFSTLAKEMVNGSKEEVKVYGEWAAKGDKTCTVNFHPQGGLLNGAEEIYTENVKIGEKAEGPSAAVGKGSAVFGGWYADEEYWEPFVLIEKPVIENQDVYARWVYEVNYETAYGTAPDPDIVRINGFLAPPNSPYAEGYSFAGWKTSDGKMWDFWEDKVTGPMTLTAVWNVVVSFDARGGSPTPADITVPEKSTIKKPAEVPYLDEDHKFLGWYEDLDVGEPFQFADEATGTDGTPVETSMTLNAKYQGWEDAGAHKLILQIQKGGKLVNTVKKYYNEGDVIEIRLEVEDGYEFLGWLPPNEGNISDVNSLNIQFTMPDKNASIVAQFQKKKDPPKPDPEPEPDPKPDPDPKPEPDPEPEPVPPAPSAPSAPAIRPSGGGGGGTKGGGQSGGTKINGSDNSMLDKVLTGQRVTPETSTAGQEAAQQTAAPAATYNVNGRAGAGRMAEVVARNAERDVVLQSDNFTFRFAKGTMRMVPGKTAYDFGGYFDVQDQNIIEDAAGGALALTVHYNYDGQLPAEAEITMNVGRQYAGQTLYYYYYNPETQALEFMQPAAVSQDGTVTVRQTHCSDYAFLTVNLYDEEPGQASGRSETERETGSVQNAERQSAARSVEKAAAPQVQAAGAGSRSSGTANAAGRRLPASGEGSPLALLVFGGAALASSLVFIRRFRRELKKEKSE